MKDTKKVRNIRIVTTASLYLRRKSCMKNSGVCPLLQRDRYKVESLGGGGASLLIPVVKPRPFPPDCLPNLNLTVSQGPYTQPLRGPTQG